MQRPGRAPVLLVFSPDLSIRAAMVARMARIFPDCSSFEREELWIRAAAATEDSLMVLCCRGDNEIVVLDRLRGQLRRRLLVIAAGGSESLAVAALRAGAGDYLIYPVADETLHSAAARVVNVSVDCGGACGPSLPAGPVLVGESEAMQAIRADIRNIAASESNVLITGETGTGKELIASLIHENSRRAAKPLACLNCAAIPDALLESELFGYERGAFTGAVATNDGKLKAADGGTVFFDEIGDLSSFAQAKLLRLIDTKEVQRLGNTRSFHVDVRIMAATHRDLEAMTSADTFRRDLYFRLNVARIHVPALRERRSDIAPIANHIVAHLNRELGTGVEGFADEVIEHLLRHDWPGNVRELRNMVEGIFIRRQSGQISAQDLPRAMRSPCTGADPLPPSELVRLLSALNTTKWNKSKAAEKLHWSRMTLYRKMAKYKVTATGN